MAKFLLFCYPKSAVFEPCHIFDVKSGRLLQKLESQGQGFLESVTWSPDGSFIASGATDGLVRVRPTGLIGHKTEPNILLQEAETRTGFKIQGVNAKRAPLNQLLPPSEDIPIATWSTLTEKGREPK